MQVTVDDRLDGLAQISQKKLQDILYKISGRKDFIIDTSCIKPLEHIVTVSKLKDCGVDEIYKLDAEDTPLTNTQRVFFVSSELTKVKRVSDKINAETSRSNDGNSYHIILVGRKLQSIVNLLEKEGIHGLVSLYTFQWELIKLDSMFLSMENPSLFKSLYVDADFTMLPLIAKSLWTLNMILGKPTVTVLQGKYSHMIDKILTKMYSEFGSPSTRGNETTCLMVVDRDTDYPSALLTGSTYCSLLDEVFGIKSGIVEIEDKKSKTQGYLLNNNDEIYSQIKGRHFSGVFPYLSARTKELKQTEENSQSMEVSQMLQFITTELSAVENFKRSLAYHIGACESIINRIGLRYEGLQNAEQNIIECRNRRETLNYIEDCLSMNICDKFAVLRLICLMSVTQDGLYQDELQRLKNQFFHLFGYQFLPTFYALEKAGLCTELQTLLSSEVKGVNLASKVAQAVPLPTRRSAFAHFAQKLKLFPDLNETSNLSNPTDPSYVFGRIYTPAFCQIVHLLCKSDITFEELPKLLPNCSVKTAQEKNPKVKTFIVFIVGGVTYAELSALQLVEKLTNTRIITASTSTINGNTIMKSFVQ